VLTKTKGDLLYPFYDCKPPIPFNLLDNILPPEKRDSFFKVHEYLKQT